MLPQYGLCFFLNDPRCETLNMSNSQGTLLRNVAAITIATGFSGLARSCLIAQRLSADNARAEKGHYGLSAPLLSDG